METERTGWHRAVERWLDELGIGYESEYTGFPPYKLDIYLPDVRATVEVDGPRHMRRGDTRRDLFLFTRYGVMTLRLRSVKGLTKTETVDVIRRFMETAGRTVRERRQRVWELG